MGILYLLFDGFFLIILIIPAIIVAALMIMSLISLVKEKDKDNRKQRWAAFITHLGVLLIFLFLLYNFGCIA